MVSNREVEGKDIIICDCALLRSPFCYDEITRKKGGRNHGNRTAYLQLCEKPGA